MKNLHKEYSLFGENIVFVGIIKNQNLPVILRVFLQSVLLLFSVGLPPL